ncbi:MAG: hypothetical protein ACI4ET_06905 [Bilifractor sp.]
MKLYELKLGSEPADACIPKHGQMMLYLVHTKPVFESYQSLDQVRAFIGDRDILEIHLFNSAVEYRAIVSESRRFHGKIEQLIDFPYDRQDPLSVYAEDVALEDGRTLTILNKIHYDEQGMASIENYRLRLSDGGKENG